MIPRGYLTPTCGECGRTFDLLNADDAAEWGYGHDCETPDANTCDGCGKDYPHALTTWQGHAGQGEYCAACLPVAREGNPLTLPRDTVADVLNRHGIAHHQTPRGIVAGNPDNAANNPA